MGPEDMSLSHLVQQAGMNACDLEEVKALMSV